MSLSNIDHSLAQSNYVAVEPSSLLPIAMLGNSAPDQAEALFVLAVVDGPSAPCGNKVRLVFAGGAIFDPRAADRSALRTPKRR
jgi:hypothetical protein